MSSLRNAYTQVTNSEFSILLRNMTSDGLPLGPQSLAVDGSVTPVEFFIQPPPGFRFHFNIVSIEISDSGNPVLTDYGSITGPLPNGLVLFQEIRGVSIEGFAPLKTNRDLINLAPDITRTDFLNNISVEVYNFDISKHSESSTILNGNTNDRFGVRVQDDLSSLVDHTIVVKGSIRRMIV